MKRRIVSEDEAQQRPSMVLLSWQIPIHQVFYSVRLVPTGVARSIVLRVDRRSTRIQGLDLRPDAHNAWPTLGAKRYFPAPIQRRSHSNQVVSAAPNCPPAQSSALGIVPTPWPCPQVDDISTSRRLLDQKIENLEQSAPNCSSGKAPLGSQGQSQHAQGSNARSLRCAQGSDNPL